METDSDDEHIGNGETINQDNALKEATEKPIHRFLVEPKEIISNPKTTLKADFSVFEATNKRTKNLEILFDTLQTIKPSPVASERVFSSSGNFVSKIRTRLSHHSVNILGFLILYFLKKNTN
jgi:hypothetical protein